MLWWKFDGMMGDFEKEKSRSPEGGIATDKTLERPMEKGGVIEENEIVMPIYQAYDKEQELIPVERDAGGCRQSLFIYIPRVFR